MRKEMSVYVALKSGHDHQDREEQGNYDRSQSAEGPGNRFQ
jgi:hypothetical protein